MNKNLEHLDILESEAIYIIRETVAEFKNPVVMYSIGKDSSVLLHLVLKAFAPCPPPIQFVHIDTGWKFKEMIAFRDNIVKKYNLNLTVYSNPDVEKYNLNPFSGSKYTDFAKTKALKKILKKLNCDVAIGGARRDEEKSRAKERIFSFRNQLQAWDPKNQRPELFGLFNTKINEGESMRSFPLSNWQEKDIWKYIKRENIEIVDLYFAKERPYIIRDNMIIMVDDNRLNIQEDEEVQKANIRFRTLGCYPLTAGMYSEADNLDKIIEEMQNTEYSERQGRIIDKDSNSSMEKKKLEGYF